MNQGVSFKNYFYLGSFLKKMFVVRFKETRIK